MSAIPEKKQCAWRDENCVGEMTFVHILGLRHFRTPSEQGPHTHWGVNIGEELIRRRAKCGRVPTRNVEFSVCLANRSPQQPVDVWVIRDGNLRVKNSSKNVDMWGLDWRTLGVQNVRWNLWSTLKWRQQAEDVATEPVAEGNLPEWLESDYAACSMQPAGQQTSWQPLAKGDMKSQALSQPAELEPTFQAARGMNKRTATSDSRSM